MRAGLPSWTIAIRVGRAGRPARTHYGRLAEWADSSLLEVRLETGRTHQIRGHLASVGHGLIGDQVYGRGSATPADPGRVWLHAAQLQFSLPNGEKVEVVAPLAQDLDESLAAMPPPLTGEVDL